jgi:hypothetical protein
MLPAWQAYSTLYYQKKIKDVVTSRWKMKWECSEDYDPAKKIPSPSIDFINATTKSMWADETPEVRAEVEKYRKDHAGTDGRTVEVDGEDEVGDAPGPEEQARRARAKQLQRSVTGLALLVCHSHFRLFKEHWMHSSNRSCHARRTSR